MASLRSIASLTILLAAMTVQTQGAPAPRYKVKQLYPPAAMTSGCLDAYGFNSAIGRINDFGVANASFSCYTAVDLPASVLQQKSRGLVVATWFPGFELPTFNPGYSYSNAVTNRGEVFGSEFGTAETGGIFAAKWTVLGGHERIFFDPACDTIQFQAGVAGNDRYIVGWALRGDPTLPPPVDLLCIKTRWVIRDAAGVETSGPLGGSPWAINAYDVAVGHAEGAAIGYHVPSGKLTVLHAPDAAHSSEATDINDLGDIVGRVTRSSQPGFNYPCDPSVAVRWDRNGGEHSLPHLPGAVSSHAFGVGYHGEIVGDSGAGNYCDFTDNATERAVLWKDGRAHDLTALIPKSAGITLTYAYSVNRRGQITAGGYVNDEPSRLCVTQRYDPTTGIANLVTVSCHNQRMFVLTPVH
jgi:uncharacterized membrane protein